MLSMLRQRDVYPRIYVSPRELDQALERDARPGGHQHRVRRFAHPARPCRSPRPPRRWRRSRTSRATSAGARRPGRGFRPARARLLEGAVRARARQARLAPHGPAAAVHRRPRRQHEAGRRQRAGAHADGFPPRAARRHARRRQRPGHGRADPRAPHPDAAERGAGRRDDAAAARGAARPHPGGRGLRRARERDFRGSWLGDPRAATSAGRSPGTFDPRVRGQRSPRLQQNEISEPFRTQFGWHIVQLLGKRTHDQSDELRRQRVLTRTAREQGRRGDRAVAATPARRGLRRDQESLNDETPRSSRPASPRASALSSRSPRRSPTGPWNSSLPATRTCSPRAPRRSALASRLPPGSPTHRLRRTAPVRCRCSRPGWPATSWPGVRIPANARYVLATARRAQSRAASPGDSHAMVTAPVQKATINDAGIPFPGHTEYLAAKAAGTHPVMLLVAGRLRVALATTHLPLSRGAAGHHARIARAHDARARSRAAGRFPASPRRASSSAASTRTPARAGTSGARRSR